MKEAGTVSRIEGEKIFLSCGTPSACKGCAAGSFCKTRDREIEALNLHHIDIQAGDEVEIFLPPGRTIFSGFVVLIFPLLTFILGYISAASIVPDSGEGVAALFGLIGLAVGFGMSYFYNRLNRKKNFPEVVRKL
ncbi:MAG: SoxR reducing system RseC family protein [Spirochaetota bacterium]|nr:SoxR reducing system RseC family protein [Spirochaetota bacterium]